MRGVGLWLPILLATMAAGAGCRRPSIENGAALYKKNCVGCHVWTPGRSVTAPSLAGYFVRRPAPSEGEARRIIGEGRRYMPPFGERLNSDQMDDLIAYLKTL